MKKPIVGQIVYSLNVGNAARNCEQVLTKKVVTSVGRKYFTVNKESGNKWTEIKYNLSDWSEVTEYSADSCLYESEHEYEDEKKSLELIKFISARFISYSKSFLSLDKLTRIKDIIDEVSI